MGNLFESKSMRLLKQDKIDVIMNCTSTQKNEYPDQFEYKRFPVYDNFQDAQKIYSMFQEATDFLREKNEEKKRVFVHCAQGISRSVTLVLAYLIADAKLSFEDALQFVRNRRPQAMPNIAFALKLRVWEKQQSKIAEFSLRDSIKQLTEVYWDTALENDAIQLIKNNVKATKAPEQEFSEAICCSFDWSEARIKAVYRALASLSDTIDIRSVISLVNDALPDLSIDVPLVGTMFAMYFLSPAISQNLLTESEVKELIEKLPENLVNQINKRIQIGKFHADKDIIVV